LATLAAQVGLDQLDINALIKVLTEPKNAMVAQYHALFEMVCSCSNAAAAASHVVGSGWLFQGCRDSKLSNRF
jgi:ATP-dependent protease Clp ATPase subunit